MRSSGSTSLSRRVRGVSSLGVSSSIGSLANRGSFTSRRNGPNPMHPLPMCSCRSTRLAQGFFESFKWKALRREKPTIFPNCLKVAAYPSGEQMS